MTHGRRRRRKLTPRQERFHNEAHVAQVYATVLAEGLGEQLKHIYDEEDFEIVKKLIIVELGDAIRQQKSAEDRFDASLKRPKKK